jgi:hypothetical protein
MTAAEMKENFLVLYDKVTNFAAPGYEDSEIAIFMNKAQLQYVKRKYNYKGNMYQEGFEETEKRRKDLSELVRNAELTSSDVSSSQTGVSPNGVFYDLPTDLLYTLREEVTLSSSDECIDGNRISVKPITHDEYTINIKNPFKKPDTSLVWRLDFSRESSQSGQAKRHELVPGNSYTISTYHLRYLKLPREIVFDAVTPVDSELDESTHAEIVDIAVRIASGITDPQTYQIKVNEEKVTE